MNKPEYRVPSMDEIANMPWNGYNAVSTFSGAGGSSLGYRMAGYRVLWASEFIPAAQEVYNANKAPYTILDNRDIREVSGQDILDATGLSLGEIDLFDGSPPCASFSTAGKREAGWGKEKKYSNTVQRVDDLFFEFSRLVRETQPKTFVAENVSGLVKGTAKGYFKWILNSLRENGYKVSARLLDAQWLGVPQARERIIFVGVREDLELEPEFPEPLPYRYSIRDAIPWIARALYDTGSQFQKVQFEDRPAPTILASNSTIHWVEEETDISGYAIEEEWKRLKVGEYSEKYYQLYKADPDRPSTTILATGSPGSSGITHPYEKRKFSIAELKRISGFPDDFILSGSFTQQWERLGRAVPPVMMMHIASAVRDKILRRLDVKT